MPVSSPRRRGACDRCTSAALGAPGPYQAPEAGGEGTRRSPAGAAIQSISPANPSQGQRRSEEHRVQPTVSAFGVGFRPDRAARKPTMLWAPLPTGCPAGLRQVERRVAEKRTSTAAAIAAERRAPVPALSPAPSLRRASARPGRSHQSPAVSLTAVAVTRSRAPRRSRSWIRNVKAAARIAASSGRCGRRRPHKDDHREPDHTAARTGERRAGSPPLQTSRSG